jgi:hypothetical protein
MSWDEPRFQVTPDCCEAMRFARAIVLRCDMDDTTGYLSPEPYWYLRLASSMDILGDKWAESEKKRRAGEEHVDFYDQLMIYTQGQHLHCPFCGKPVPQIERKPDSRQPKKVQEITDGGYYCDTCNKRANECRCPPPWMQWRVKR